MAAIWGVMLVLAHVERGELVQVLTAKISNGNEKEAGAALDQIVRMPEPPLDVLVAAAASPTRQIARHAQTSISELLRKWQRQLTANRRVRRIAHQLELLVATLDENRNTFSTRDHAWLAKTAERIVRLANAAPPQDALGLAVHCESLVALTNSYARSTPESVVPVASTAIELAPDRVFSSPTRIALQSIVPDSAELHESGGASPSPFDDDAPPDLPPGWSDSTAEESSIASLPPPFYRRHRAEADAAAPIPKTNASPVESTVADSWAELDSRALLERWLTANGTPQLQIAHELERRGFGSPRADLVRLALSDNTNGRVQLVHDLLDLQGVGTKAWLLLFAHDADAEVRFAAVTVMATSHDAALLEAAWQVVLHDRDPRIASLVDRLRERRGSARQR